jgi:hypothetical protein
MSRKVVMLALCILAMPRMSSAQVMITYVFSPPYNANALIMGGVAVPLVKVQRVSVGVGIDIGVIVDKNDPYRWGQRHVHFTWMPMVPVTLRVGESWGLVGGWGYGFVKESAKTHLTNYPTFFAGLAFGLTP